MKIKHLFLNNNVLFKSFILLLLSFNVIGQNISIRGIFPEDCEFNFTIYFYKEKLPTRTFYQKIEQNQAEQTVTILVSSEEIKHFHWFQLYMKELSGRIYLKEVVFSNILKADAIDIRNSLYIHPNSCTYDIETLNGKSYFVFRNLDEWCSIVVDLKIFYCSSPIGIQLFLRLSLLATILILIFILCKQAPIQRFILFSIALFLASLSLKIDYTNYTMGIMTFTMLIAFIYNKSCYFKWQPIFYILCAMYLIIIIGLAYTEDFNIGIKRLDTTIVLILFPVVFSMILFLKKNVILLLRFFVWAAIAFCTFGLLSYFTIVPEFTWNMVFKDSKLYSPLLMMWPAHPHPSYLSTILLMAVPVALYLRYQDEKQITMIEMLLGVLLPIVFTILSGARVGMMIVPALLILGYLFYCKFKPALKWGLVVAGIAVVGVMFHFFPTTDDRFVDPIRVDLRKTAISAIKEKPVFGWGTGSAKLLIHSEERAHHLGIETPHQFNQFHNQYLEDMVQFGVFGILILLVLFGWLLWIGIHEKNYVLLSLFVIYVLFCWTETVLFVAKGVMPFTFWLCFLIANRANFAPSKIDSIVST